ncbi:MAG: hypothetical protein HY808_03130, partial [Nitrospirae bacterium]|nr:hypothetical protein [Nitrospirota bacterium]
MRGTIETQNIVAGLALNKSGQTQMRDIFPLGNGFYTLFLDFKFAYTKGATPPTGLKIDGLLNIIKSILIKTDRDGVLVNANGKGIYHLFERLTSIAPVHEPIVLATDGTYRLTIPIYFALPHLLREMDTIADTKRYTSFECYITLGSESDLFTVVNTGAITVTLDATIEGTQVMLSADGEPLMLPYIINTPAVAASKGYIDLERSEDLGYLALLVHTGINATEGVPFSGDDNSGVVNDFSIEDNYGFIYRTVPAKSIQSQNMLEYEMSSVGDGFYMLEFSKDNSVMSALPSGNKTRLQLKWNGATGTSPVVSALVLGVKRLH